MRKNRRKTTVKRMKIIDTGLLQESLHLLHEQLVLQDMPKTELVICGGSALIAMGLVLRTTRDVDIVALMRSGRLESSSPLPDYIIAAAHRVAEMLHLPPDWLNNGPASQLTMGVPDGFADRLHGVEIGELLHVYYIDRIDQIYFKTFASADRGGYHIDDLKQLNPTEEELYAAAQWCMSQDVSEGFRYILKEMLTKSGWSHVSDRI